MPHSWAPRSRYQCLIAGSDASGAYAYALTVPLEMAGVGFRVFLVDQRLVAIAAEIVGEAIAHAMRVVAHVRILGEEQRPGRARRRRCRQVVDLRKRDAVEVALHAIGMVMAEACIAGPVDARRHRMRRRGDR